MESDERYLKESGGETLKTIISSMLRKGLRIHLSQSYVRQCEMSLVKRPSLMAKLILCGEDNLFETLRVL